MAHRTLQGKIGYYSRRSGETGREWFTVTVMPDGSRTLRTCCEMDDASVLRDVTYTIDAAWRPVDAYIRLSVADRFVGSSWFRFLDDAVECEALTASEGRVSQRVDLPQRAARFGTHSLITDGWHAVLWDPQGPDRQVLRRQPASSHAADGGTGPLVVLGDSTLHRIGDERVCVPAGEFDTTHFSIDLVDYPPLHFWVTGPDVTLVRIEWTHLDAYYELLELRQSGSVHG
jgi:hypothetical protein